MQRRNQTLLETGPLLSKLPDDYSPRNPLLSNVMAPDAEIRGFPVQILSSDLTMIIGLENSREPITKLF